MGHSVPKRALIVEKFLLPKPPQPKRKLLQPTRKLLQMKSFGGAISQTLLGWLPPLLPRTRWTWHEGVASRLAQPVRSSVCDPVRDDRLAEKPRDKESQALAPWTLFQLAL